MAHGYPGPPGYGPPTGGYGAPGYGPAGHGPPGYGPPPKKSNLGVILLVIGLALIPVLGVMAALSIYGVRRYLQSAKTSEVKNNVGEIARAAVAAYERESTELPAQRGMAAHKLCDSASTPVPRVVPMGKKYQPSPADWEIDKATNAGFACLRFSSLSPQYYQYDYKATPTGFVVTATGDLDGDGVTSTFTLRGTVVGVQVRMSNLEVTNEFE